MANNDFLRLQTDLADRVNVDISVAANLTRLKRYINQTVQDVSGRWPWKWLERRQMIQTVADQTDGTVSITNGATAVTGVGTAFVADDAYNSYIQFEGNSDWYLITARSSGTAITIDQAFGQTTLSGATYTVRRVYYALGNDVDRVVSVRGFTSPRKLTQLPQPAVDRFDPALTNVGTPLAYSVVGTDPNVAVSGQPKWRLMFEPIPTSILNFEVRTRLVPTDLSSDTDVCIVPYKHCLVVLDGAEYLYLKHQNDPNWTNQRAVYEAGIDRMIADGNQDEDVLYVLQPNELPSTNGFIPMPGQYEPPS